MCVCVCMSECEYVYMCIISREIGGRGLSPLILLHYIQYMYVYIKFNNSAINQPKMTLRMPQQRSQRAN